MDNKGTFFALGTFFIGIFSGVTINCIIHFSINSQTVSTGVIGGVGLGLALFVGIHIHDEFKETREASIKQAERERAMREMRRTDGEK